ncbi:hypothetical protein CIRMBP1204_00229 [Enterococcus cecorum]|nr:hypothetical protein CIRMBP1204_00229 [Enterococcus cecorum]
MGQSPAGKTYNDFCEGMPFYQGKTEFGDLYIGEPTTWTTAPSRIAVANDVLMSVRATVGSTNIAKDECCIGRGLRKDKDKEYLVVLDFIGNYKNNYMIPIALSGDRSYNKDNIRKFISESDRTIPGASTIHFDEVSRKKIFESIDGANFDSIQLIKDAYKGLRQKIRSYSRTDGI